jgi:hypothetical protein
MIAIPESSKAGLGKDGDPILQRIGVAIMGWFPVNCTAAASSGLALARQACVYEGTKAKAGRRGRLSAGAK